MRPQDERGLSPCIGAPARPTGEPSDTPTPMPPDPFPLRTARLRIRRLRADDLADFHALRADADVGRWQGWTPITEDEATAFIAAMADGPWHRPGDWTQVVVADGDTDRFLGDLGLHWPATVDGPLEIGFSFARHAQGRGLAAEALHATLRALLATGRARGVVAITDARNDASVRLLERLGFTRRATEPAVFRGEPCLEHHYALDDAAALAPAAPPSAPPPPSPTAR